MVGTRSGYVQAHAFMVKVEPKAAGATVQFCVGDQQDRTCISDNVSVCSERRTHW